MVRIDMAKLWKVVRSEPSSSSFVAIPLTNNHPPIIIDLVWWSSQCPGVLYLSFWPLVWSFAILPFNSTLRSSFSCFVLPIDNYLQFSVFARWVCNAWLWPLLKRAILSCSRFLRVLCVLFCVSVRRSVSEAPNYRHRRSTNYRAFLGIVRNLFLYLSLTRYCNYALEKRDPTSKLRVQSVQSANLPIIIITIIRIIRVYNILWFLPHTNHHGYGKQINLQQ